jgi:ribonuclease Z
MFERWALLFDLGDLHALAPRKLLRIRDVFVSHAHIDHFVGFDQLLRVLVGRETTVRLYGPEGIIDRVEHRLAGYSWNLVERYDTELVFLVAEMRSPAEANTARFRFRCGFQREPGGSIALVNGALLDDGGFRVRAAPLDHRIPCLGFAIEERQHVNVWKNRVEALGPPVGPWLRELKKAVLRGDPDDAPFYIRWREAGAERELAMPLGELRREILRLVPGQKIGYITDVVYNDDNARRVVDLVREADILFIEAAFARADAARAAERCHLTTEQAGRIARLAGAKRVEPFHFSSRYAGEADRMLGEVETAFRGELLPIQAAGSN